jgi:hypothetical protein
MTIDEIKTNLPMLQVKVKLPDNNVVVGRISGRKLQFPKVYIPGYGIHYHKVYAFQSWEFTWSAIEHAINNDTALIV